MPRNGSGAYARAVSAYVYNTTIDQVQVNAEMVDIAAALTASLAKDGQTVPTANLPMGGFKHTGLAAGSAAGNSLRYEQLFTTGAVQLLGAINMVKGADVASANALTLGADGNYFDITGTTAITSIGTLGIGTVIKLHFDGALTLTHHATDLILPGGASIITAAGDEAEFVEYAAGDWRCTSFSRASYVAFRAYQSTLNSVTSSSDKITLDAETFDTATCFASSRFTPNVEGYYQINGAIQFATGNYAVRAAIYKNGSLYAYGQSSSTGSAANVGDVVYLNGSTDYVELYGYSETTQNTATGTTVTYFSGAKV